MEMNCKTVSAVICYLLRKKLFLLLISHFLSLFDFYTFHIAMQVLEDFPSVQMPFEWLVQLVPPLKTRAFSISSSHSVHPNQVHLTVSVVSWTTPYKRKRAGLCSSWLAGVDPQKSMVFGVIYN